jgi:hypothetical protein
MDAWKDVQKAIAASLGTDPMVVNPSRIMRVAGTVSWPNKDKVAKGYVPELVTMRTSFSTDRDPVPFERMMRAFPKRGDGGAQALPSAELFIDTGRQAMTEPWQKQASSQDKIGITMSSALSPHM